MRPGSTHLNGAVNAAFLAAFPNGSLPAGTALTALAVVVLGVAVAVVISRRTTRPLAEITEVARAIADGNLTQAVTYEGRDEIGVLAAAFRSISERIGGALTAIADGAQTLTEASDSLSAVSQSLAAGAEETSVQAEVVSNASMQITDNIAAVAFIATEK